MGDKTKAEHAVISILDCLFADEKPDFEEMISESINVYESVFYVGQSVGYKRAYDIVEKVIDDYGLRKI